MQSQVPTNTHPHSEMLQSLDLLLHLLKDKRHLSLTLELILLDTPRHIQQILLLLHMTSLQSRSDRSTRITSGIHHVPPVMVFGLIEQSLDTGLRETPSTGVQWLFLAPNDGLGIRIRVQVFLQLGPGEGVELFDTGNSGLGQLVLDAVFVEGGVDLTRAEDDAVNLFLGGELDVVAWLVGWVGDDPLEVRFAGEVLDIGAGERVTKERF